VVSTNDNSPSFFPSVPGEPKRVKVEALNSTAIRVQWRPPLEKEQNGVIRGYQVYYSLTTNVDGGSERALEHVNVNGVLGLRDLLSRTMRTT